MQLTKSENLVFILFLALVPVYRWMPIVSNIVAADVVFIGLMGMLALRFFAGHLDFRFSQYDFLFFLSVTSVLVFGLIFSSIPDQGIDNLAQIIYLFVVLYVVKTVKYSERYLELLVLFGAIFCFLAVGELVVRPILRGGMYVLGMRFIREATHPQIVVSALMPISATLFIKNQGFKRKLFLLTTFMLYITVIFSFSRGGIIAVHFVIFLMAFSRLTRGVFNYFLYLMLFMLVAIYIVLGHQNFLYLMYRMATIFAVIFGKFSFAGENISNIHGADRVELIKATIEHSFDWKFFWGHGLDSFANDVSSFGGRWMSGDGKGTKMSAHNLPAQMIYEMGVFGILFYFGLGLYLVQKLFRTAVKDPVKNGLALSIIALMINSNTDPGVFVERVLWVVAGFAIAYVTAHKTMKSVPSQAMPHALNNT